MLILTLESTCDETAAAVINERGEVLSSVVASQEKLHEQFRGVVPEIAARAHVNNLLPVIERALDQAKKGFDDLSAIAVATTPGLAGSLLAGLITAKTLSMVLEVPLIAINHLFAHIYACQMAASSSVFPCVGFVVSGGHTHLYRCESALEFHFLGGTIDDAAGEAFDKVGSMLSLPFPGGPVVSRLAERGDPGKFEYPRAFMGEDRLEFSFSGLKTAVRYSIAGQGKLDFSDLQLDSQLKADVAASFETAVVDCLVAKSIQACKKFSLDRLCVGGGVAANRLFRRRLEEACLANKIELHIAPMKWCTDNAAMGAIAVEKYNVGDFASLDIDIAPGLIRNSVH